VHRRLAVLVLSIALVTVSCGPSTEGVFGGELYEISCAGCHLPTGEGGRGPAIGTPDSNAALTLSDDQIAATIRVGPGIMPAFKRLTDDQVESLVAHLRRLQQSAE
jgi:mono/diheme cytochrome c family protein